MTRIYEFRNSRWQEPNELLTSMRVMASEELKNMAEKIFLNGKIEKEEAYATENQFTVRAEGLPIKYIVKIDCLEVNEIIEMVEV